MTDKVGQTQDEFRLAYRIVWWLAVLSNAVAAYFVMIATVTAYFAGYSLNLFDGTVGVGTAGSLLAVIVLVWEWIPRIRSWRDSPCVLAWVVAALRALPVPPALASQMTDPST
jgi:hypothetical protein